MVRIGLSVWAAVLSFSSGSFLYDGHLTKGSYLGPAATYQQNQFLVSSMLSPAH